MPERPDLRGITWRYAGTRRIERVLGRRRSLPDDALLVVLEWGPPRRLPEAWRLQQRRPRESVSRRDAALADAHEVTHTAYELTGQARPGHTAGGSWAARSLA